MPGTIRDIRKLTGLSLSTISKYLNGGNVLPENRKSIEKAIAELGYEVNEVARWLATNKTKTIGVLVYNIQSLFNGMLLSYIGSSLHTLGYGMLICDSADRWMEFLQSRLTGSGMNLDMRRRWEFLLS